MDLIRTHVVIDWRNLHGQLALHGLEHDPLSANGLHRVFAGFGLDVAHVSVCIGLNQAVRSGALLNVHQRNQSLARAWRSYGWEVREGLVRHRADRHANAVVGYSCHCGLVVERNPD